MRPAMLQETWCTVAASTDVVDGQPLAVVARDRRLVVFRRADGSPAVLSDVCVHRGGALSGGWLNDDRTCVVCPYHLWEFDGTGQCTHIPANTAGLPIPPSVRVQSHPCVERDGTVWAFLDDVPDDGLPPLPPSTDHPHQETQP